MTYFKKFESQHVAAQVFATEDESTHLVTVLLSGEMVSFRACHVRELIEVLKRVDACVLRREAARK